MRSAICSTHSVSRIPHGLSSSVNAFTKSGNFSGESNSVIRWPAIRASPRYSASVDAPFGPVDFFAFSRFAVVFAVLTCDSDVPAVPVVIGSVNVEVGERNLDCLGILIKIL